tara:strand:- start:2371 stop:2577 length:207 start_codon:yes stop_codon:yes gene_type:complete
MKCTIQKQVDCYLPYDADSVDLTSRKKDGALFVVDASSAKSECEKNLPRGQECVVIVTATPEELTDEG